MIAIIGLGNPGKEYQDTYHNVGYMAVDQFAHDNRLVFSKTKYNSMYAEGMVNGQKVIVLKPTTYMNLSGTAVVSMVNALKLPLNNLIVVCDDIDLPVGQLRLRRMGSGGTHNGMRNIVSSLGSTQFNRLRVGIGRDDRMDLKDYVLGKIKGDNKVKLDSVMPKISKILSAFVEIGNVERIDINNY